MAGAAHQRVREAVLEIKTVARRDPVLAAEGAVLILDPSLWWLFVARNLCVQSLPSTPQTIG
jgi:hypothetical protein